MTVIESAVNWALSIANDNSHGYSQQNRWGPDYDCSSFVISAFQQAGIPVKDRGATYTGNMRGPFLASGFVDVTLQVGLGTGYGLQAGDVLLNYSAHTALYVGSGKVVHARSSEGNSIQGDQSGNEIRVQSYWNYPWNCVLRYKGRQTINGGTSSSESTILQKGSSGTAVKTLQQKLIDAGYSVGPDGADGQFGQNTLSALLQWQRDNGKTQSGVINVKDITQIVAKKPETQTVIVPTGPVKLPKLEQGSSGDDVVLLQALLNKHGFSCGKADGAFGPATSVALNRFKQSESLNQNGVCDEEAWRRLLKF